MKEIKNGEAVQSLGQNVAFQFKGIALDTTLNGTVKKIYDTVKAMVAAPPQEGDWNNYIVFPAADTNKHYGIIDPDALIEIEGIDYIWIETDAAGEYLVNYDEYTAIAEGTGLTLKVYWREQGSVSEPSEIGLVSAFGDTTEGAEINLYPYAEGKYASTFLGQDDTASHYTLRGEDCYQNDSNANEFYYWLESEETADISIEGEKSTSSDWDGFIRYYVESTSPASEGYVYITERIDEGDIYPVKNGATSGEQGAPTITSINDIDLYYSVNGIDYIKNKDVASNIEIFNNQPRGMYWRADTSTDFAGWISE